MLGLVQQVKFNGVTQPFGTTWIYGTCRGLACTQITFGTSLPVNTNFFLSWVSTARLILSPSSGPSFTVTNLSGTGFNPNKSITVTYNGNPIATAPASITTDGSGSFGGSITIPLSTPGAHTIQACDSTNLCALASFSVTAPQISNFAAGQQMGNLTSVMPVLTSDTQLLALSQSLYYSNGTLVSQINYPSPVTIPANTATDLTPFTQVITSQVTYYETVSSTDGLNTFTTQSQGITFIPTHFQQSNNNFGQQNFTVSNPNQVSIYYKRVDVNSTLTNLLVTYPNNFNLTCTMNFAISQTNKTFSHLSSTPIPGTSNVQSTFSFKNTSNDIITIVCTDPASGTSATYVLTQTANGIPSFPLIQYVQNFRAGQYGTHGQIGAIDIISLICIFIAMVGLSRVNEAAGIVLATIVLGFLAFFQLVQWPTVLTGAIAVIIMIAITSTKKLPWSQ